MCGIYSLIAAASAMDVSVDPHVLWDSKFVSQQEGSTASDLIEAAEQFGIRARCRRNLSIADLAASETPMLLHTRSRFGGESFEHWVAFLGRDSERNFRILDPPFEVEAVSPAAVMANWNGIAVCLDYDSNRSFSLFSIRRLANQGGSALLILAVLLVLDRVLHLSGRTVKAQVAAIICLSAGLAGIHHTYLPTGFAQNPIPTGMVKRRHFDPPSPTVGLSEVESAIRHGEALLVDSRKKFAFERGTIPGSTNLPVDAPLGHFERAAADIATDADIIVFCQSPTCHYADRVAKTLILSGFSKVSIFPGGYSSWSQSKVNATPSE